MKRFSAILSVLSLALAAQAQNLFNVDMTFDASGTYARTATIDWPDNPDNGAVTGPDFLFSDGVEKLWKLNDGANVILQQSGGATGGRFFPGVGGDGIVTFTSDSGQPGRISARFNAFAAMRIGLNSHSGTVNIDGGVSFETGWIFGAGTGSRSLNIVEGEFAVYSDNTSKRLNDIDVTIHPGGSLWIQDPLAEVTDLGSFQSFVSGATLTPVGGTLQFTNNVFRPSLLGDTPPGTLIEVLSTSDPEMLLDGPFYLASALSSRTIDIPFANSGPSLDLVLDPGSEVVLSGPDAAFFSVTAFDATVAPGGQGVVSLAFDPTLPGGGARDYTATLILNSNDAQQAAVQAQVQVSVHAAEPGLVSHFTFDDSFNPALDLGTYANSGTLQDDAAFTSAGITGNGALSLDGDGDFVDLGAGSGLDYTSGLIDDGDGFTLACWAHIPASAPDTFTRFFSTYMPSGFTSTGWSVGFAAGGRLLATTYGVIDYLAAGGSTPPRDEWHHYAYVFRGDPVNRVDYYLDGALVDTFSTGSSGLNPAPGERFAIGCLGLPGNQHFTSGRLDDLRVYDRELPASEIEDLIPPDSDPAILTDSEIALGEVSDSATTNFSLQIHNDGLLNDLLISGATWSGPDAGNFSTSSDLSSPLVIAPGDSQLLQLAFDPAGDIGAFEATLQLASNDSNEPLVSVSLSASVVPAVGKAAMLFVHAHPDDESIFGGGVLPYYSQVRDLPVAVLSMVTRNPNGSDPLTSGLTSRLGELRRAMDLYAGQAPGSGLDLGAEYITGNIRQVDAGFIDTGCCGVPPDDSWSDAGDGFGWGASSGASQVSPGFGNLELIADGRVAAARVVARQIRRFRPEILVTCHDLEGDYGHSNHTATAIACVDAYTLAADPGVDIDGLPPWQVKKLYLRGGPTDNRETITYSFADPEYPSIFISDGGVSYLFHEFFEELTLLGFSPRQVADDGLDEHASQGNLDVTTVFRSGETFDGHHSEWWTLYRTELGADFVSNNFTISGDTTLTSYLGWARGVFLDHLLLFPDSDEDGLPNAWELAWGGGEEALLASGDEDGDGYSNQEEFALGLNPSQSDRLPVTVSADGSTITFTVPASSGDGYEFLERRWRLHYSPDLEDWSQIVAEGDADGGPADHVIGSAGENPGEGFYRLHVFLQ